MIHELRIYRCVPNRLPALLKRFETVTLDIWERHGIKQAGFWTTLVGESNQELTYLIAWESMAEREQKWPAFLADPSGSTSAPKARRTADRRQRAERLLAADVVFVGEMISAYSSPA